MWCGCGVGVILIMLAVHWGELGSWGLRVLVAALDILRPIADVLVRVEDQVGWAGHVVFAFSFAHEIVGTITLVRMVADVAILFSANDFVGIFGGVGATWIVGFIGAVIFQMYFVVL